MATITSTPTGGTLTANKNKEVKGTISWSKPTVPSGATISSCVLTGKATASMSNGSVTITVNGITVTSGSTFTINLGTANNTTSVDTSIQGTNNKASGSVSFSELLYTVTYTEQVVKPTYIVTFVDWDRTTLKTETVEEGNNATAPANPSRDGYNFIGWDNDFSNVTSDLTVTAQYKKELEIIEWTGIGTVATGLRAHAGNDGYSHDNYKINLDWENESFDIIIVDELGRSSSYSYNIGAIGDIKIGDTILSILFSDGAISIYSNNTDNVLEYYNSDYGYYPFVVSFTKKGIYVKSSATTGEYSTPEFLSGSENIYEINRPIYLIDDGLIRPSVSNQENPKYDILFDLAVSEYSEQTEEPEEDIIEWTGIGTVATNIYAEDYWKYKLNMDWDTQYLEISFNGKNRLGSANLFYWVDIMYLWNDTATSTNDSRIIEIDDEGYPYILGRAVDEDFISSTPECTVRFSKINQLEVFKDGVLVGTFTDNLIINQSIIYLSSHDFEGNSRLGGSYAGGTITSIEVKSVEPDNNELVQGDINEDGTFNDESTTVVRTKYIDISDKKSIQVNVLTDNVYISACYLYNANKELVKVIEIPADKKRKFGVNLQELIAQIIEDEGGDQ